MQSDDELWTELGQMPVPVPDAASTERIAQHLRQEITKRKDRGTMKPMWLAAAMLAGALLGGTGTQLWNERAERSPAGDQFLLLLHEDASLAIPDERLNAVVAEYAAWAGKLNEEKRLVSAEKLRDDGGQWLGAAGAIPDATPAETIGGFFLIRAGNYDEALSIARQSPHLKYGGTIEVRAIEKSE